jgi:hypothetical protein
MKEIKMRNKASKLVTHYNFPNPSVAIFSYPLSALAERLKNLYSQSIEVITSMLLSVWRQLHPVWPQMQVPTRTPPVAWFVLAM